MLLTEDVLPDDTVASDDKGEYNNIILHNKKMANTGDSNRGNYT